MGRASTTSRTSRSTIPRDQFVVITGVSGSGKSTLAFDLLFAEGQRRFLDSMNVYARQFVEQMARPDVDLITGIPPTVSIEQRTTRGGGKSTVATVTEIYHFIRLLFARLGTQYCPDCQLPVEAQTRDELAKQLQSELKRRGDLLLLAPIVRNRKGFHTDVAEWAAKHGYQEIRADGKMFDTSKPFRLDRFREHDVEIVVGVAASRQSAANAEQSSQRRSTETPLQNSLTKPSSSATARCSRSINRKQLTVHSTERACPGSATIFRAARPEEFQLQLRRRAGVPSAAASANCFTCRTWNAARMRIPSRKAGGAGRRNARFVPSATARG